MPADTSFEDARRCPKCDELGHNAGKQRGPNRSTIHTFTCRNEKCPWNGTGWIVQVNNDGSIADRDDERGSAANYQKPKVPRVLDSDMEKYRERLRQERMQSRDHG